MTRSTRTTRWFITADKDFELLIVPGAEHMFIDCPYDVRYETTVLVAAINEWL
jgi:hypothetical protein